MRKLLLYLIIFIIIIFLIPILFTKRFYTNQTMANTVFEEALVENDYDYKQYNTIKLLHSNSGKVEEVNLDEYLYYVVSAEMPVDFHEEALKAQAVVARTYTIYKMTSVEKKHTEADICDSAGCCQAWISKEDRFAKWEEHVREENWKKIINAVNSTNGKIITYDNKPINAFFHSNSGGTTEIPINVWGGSGYPYLQVVETSGENEYSQYSSEVVLSKEDLIKKIKEKYQDLTVDFDMEDAVRIKERTDSGRVKTIKIGNKEISGVEARTLLGLRSTNFSFAIEGENIRFSVIGYGHGVGMSQTGADALAKQGKKYEEIIKHFYVGVEIKDI